MTELTINPEYIVDVGIQSNGYRYICTYNGTRYVSKDSINWEELNTDTRLMEETISKQGQKWIKDVNIRWSKSGLNTKFTESEIDERCMRCGIELRMYKVTDPETIRTVALTTLREDKLR